MLKRSEQESILLMIGQNANNRWHRFGHLIARIKAESLGCINILFWVFKVTLASEISSSFELNMKWAVTCDFQKCGILTSVDSDEPVQPAFKLRNSKWCSVSSLTLKVYSSDKQRLWTDCAYAQADLRLCWSHIPHCWKSHATAQVIIFID